MAESSSAAAAPHPHDGRDHRRTHMFVAAVLNSAAGSCPVHIRNMSLRGALIEGGALPDLGPVTIRRGGLHASAQIVWRAGRKAGIAFERAAYPEDWMARDPQGRQALVDELIREVRGHGRDPAAAGQGAISATPSTAMELQALRADLTELGNGLSRDVIVVATHPEIQLIDVALQRVERLLKGVGRAAG